MTGPEHYLAAEQLIRQAEGEFLDDSNNPLPRAEYATDAEWDAALQLSHELSEQGLRTAVWLTAQAQAHATLALAAATALNDTDPNGEGMPGLDCRAWWQAAGTTA